MRHAKRVNHLGRKSAHRKAMLSNMAASLIIHKRIKTTVAKAKALRQYVEPLITKSKEDTTHNRRIAFSYLKHKEPVIELFSKVSDKVADRPGGYTRIIKLGNRIGDAAEICYIELVDFNETMLEEKATKTRRRRKKKKSDSDVKAAQPKPEVKANEAEQEVKDAEESAKEENSDKTDENKKSDTE